MVKRHPHANRDKVHVGVLDDFVRVGKSVGNSEMLGRFVCGFRRLVLTAVTSKSGSALNAGMWASRPQPLRILAPMMPTRIFSIAMMILTPLCCLQNLLCCTTALKTAGKSYDGQADAPRAMAVSASPLIAPPPSMTRMLAGRAIHVVTPPLGKAHDYAHRSRPTVTGSATRPHNKIASAPVISTRSFPGRSRMNSIAETKNSASNGIRFIRVIVLIISSLQPKPVQSPPRPIVASLHRGFCKCKPGLLVHSTAPGQVRAQH